jgi:hypothetical protein
VAGSRVGRRVVNPTQGETVPAPHPRYLLALAGTLLLAGSLAACGSGDDSASASADSDKAEKARLDFARCMRQHGVEVPDVTTNKGGGVLIRQRRQADTPQGRRAMEACQKYLEAARPKLSAEDRAKFRDAFVKFSSCMRKEGVDLPDPSQGEVRARVRINGSDPRIRQATEKCRKLMPGGGKGGPGTFGVGGPPPGDGK